MSALKTPGLIAVRCELSLKDKGPIGIGHGSTVISSLNRGLDRAMFSCLNGSLMSAINSACKSLDVIRLESAQEQATKNIVSVEARRENDDGEGISPKQKDLLTSLIYQRIDNEEERERRLQEVQSYSRDDASEMISSFITASQR